MSIYANAKAFIVGLVIGAAIGCFGIALYLVFT